MAAAIFFVCKFYKKWIDREIFELFSTQDTTKKVKVTGIELKRFISCLKGSEPEWSNPHI